MHYCFIFSHWQLTFVDTNANFFVWMIRTLRYYILLVLGKVYLPLKLTNVPILLQQISNVLQNYKKKKKKKRREKYNTSLNNKNTLNKNKKVVTISRISDAIILIFF
jgi:hypothetical protein